MGASTRAVDMAGIGQLGPLVAKPEGCSRGDHRPPRPSRRVRADDDLWQLHEVHVPRSDDAYPSLLADDEAIHALTKSLDLGSAQPESLSVRSRSSQQRLLTNFQVPTSLKARGNT